MIRIAEAKRGRFLVFDNDRYLGRSLLELGEFMEGQAELFDLLLKPNAVVVEVGANIGAHTVPLAKRASKVYAFEPQRRVYNMLCGNMALNGLENVECYRLAGGEKRALVSVGTLDYEAADNNFGAFSLDLVPGNIDTIQVVPIQIPCDFLKVDAEGYEANVLRGSADMIRERNPVLYVENDREEKSEELVSLISDLGYKAYWHVTDMFRPDNFRGVKDDPFNAISADMLCLPKSIAFDRLPEVKGSFQNMREQSCLIQ